MIELSLFEDIQAGAGVGELRLGCHVSDILPAIEAAGPWTVKTRAYFPRSFVYEYEDSLRLHVDVVTGTLFRIEASNEYEGTYLGSIRVGSKVRDLVSAGLCLRVEDGLLTHGDGGITFELPDEVDAVEDALDEPVVCIAVELRDFPED